MTTSFNKGNTGRESEGEVNRSVVNTMNLMSLWENLEVNLELRGEDKIPCMDTFFKKRKRSKENTGKF
jgi:hypothetical protein